MEFEGIVMQLLPVAKGTSARGEWIKQEVVLEQTDDFGRKACVTFWGDKALDAASLVPGEKVRVSVNLESREYNGRWYTEARAWKLERGTAPAPSATLEASVAAHAGATEFDWSASAPRENAAEDFDDLPF